MENTTPKERDKLDKLDTLFNMQAELNDSVFERRGITNNAGQRLISADFQDYAKGNLTQIGETNTWCSRYLEALLSECDEIKRELLVKFWSVKEIDVSKLHVEIIDAWHFMISLSIAAGMSAEDILEVYKAKHAENIKRQENGYAPANS